MPDGPGGFAQDYTCPALLRMPLGLSSLHIRNCHPLWLNFPDHSIRDKSATARSYYPGEARKYNSGLGSSPVARHYWGNHCCFLFLEVLRCFSSLGWPPCTWQGCLPFRQTGCPIRKSADQGIFAPTRALSQLITSFVASVSQGIRHAPLFSFAVITRISLRIRGQS